NAWCLGQEEVEQAEQQDTAHHDVEADVAKECVDEQSADVDEDDEEDNVLISSKIESLRNDKAIDDDDVVLSIKY
ncbi:hypothetical protein Dimus_023012, partial [Dionaea muscipula]